MVTQRTQVDLGTSDTQASMFFMLAVGFFSTATELARELGIVASAVTRLPISEDCCCGCVVLRTGVLCGLS
jgi:hypothetical protein